jgi:mannitol/fructose-specific phosphotransferase system IIA component (Ntr-type)
MKHFLVRDALVPALAATTKEGAIRELVGALQQAGYFQPAEVEAVVGEVMRREGLGSTGIGRGVAIPHDSIDGQNVRLVFLLVSRPDQPGPHLHALETIVRVSESDEFLDRLAGCKTRDEIWAIIEEAPDPWSRD